MVNFADATGDLARDGRSWTTVKDYAQWHDVARTIAGHLIDRYGADALEFTWSVFNEPDLGPLFWRASWDELQEFYDYTTDAILRAFEDRGYDSNKVFIGGLELGGIFGTNLRLREFLAHCSPRAEAEGAIPLNAAVADRRLDGKRSRRVEALCRDHEGKGSPCDFISIHSYNRSEMMAAKLIRAKEMALEIDPEYYRALWVNSHESCPDWMPPPDEAAADSYLGNGYFPTWCADVVHRQLLQAASDPRYAYGETILTVWPPPANFAGLNAVTRVLHVRRRRRRPDRPDGDRADADLPRAGAALGPGRSVLGAARADRGRPRGQRLRLARRSGGRPGLALRPRRAGHAVAIGGVVRHRARPRTGWPARARLGPRISLRSRPQLALPAGPDAPRPARLRRLGRSRSSGGVDARTPGREAGNSARGDRKASRTQSHDPRVVLPEILKLAEEKDQGVRKAAREAIKIAFAPEAYPGAAIEQVRKATKCRPTATTSQLPQADGRIRLTVRVAANGCNFVVVEPDEERRQEAKTNKCTLDHP